VVCWGGAAQLIDRAGRILRNARLGPETEAEFEELRRSGGMIRLMGLTTMIRRDAFLKVGGYDRLFNSVDDIELLSRLADIGSIRALPAILGYYRIYGNSFTASRSMIQYRLFGFIEARNKERLAGRDLELKDYLEALGRRPYLVQIRDSMAGRSCLCYGHAVTSLAERRIIEALGWGMLAVLADPVLTIRRLRMKALTAGWRRSLPSAPTPTPAPAVHSVGLPADEGNRTSSNAVAPSTIE
jgi:hypothetical protein